jgi:hypothetical protein
MTEDITLDLTETSPAPLALAASLTEEIRQTEVLINDLDAKQKAYKAQLLALMEEHGVQKIDNELVTITYVPASESLTVDTAKLKENHWEVYSECVRKTNRQASVRIKVK